MRERRGYDVGGILFGLIILGVGAYYLLQKTFGLSMPDLNWDRLWPLLVIALGLSILYSTWMRRGRGGSDQQGS